MPTIRQRLGQFWILIAALFTGGIHAQTTTYAGISGATLLDAGVMVVDDTGRFARTESFEYLRRSDGGMTLLNTIHAKDGRYRVRGRFDYDAGWNAVSAAGIGLYDDQIVNITLHRRDDIAAIRVDSGEQTLAHTAVCKPDCLLNMSPSALAMFTMTRHYDQSRGGEQLFRWAGQDLDRVRTLSGGTATLSYLGQESIEWGNSRSIAIRHYTFVETFPTEDGGTFSLNFDLWTDNSERPMGFRVLSPGGAPGGIVGFRQGFEDVRNTLTAVHQ
ncbi:MAG: hypothetical protein AB8B96_01775 [Lysobacterales bacterium]